MTTATAYPHVDLDQTGMPYIRGTRFKVVQIILDRLAYDWGADEIQKQHPQLTLGQVYGALAYYYDHKTEMDALIDERARKADEVLAALPPSPLRARLQAAKRQRGTC
jgi:uncharacterized protein (DUF433 family)